MKDVHPGGGDRLPPFYGGLTEAGGRVFFPTDDGSHGFELWVSDGTPEGTVMVEDITPGASSTSAPVAASAGALSRAHELPGRPKKRETRRLYVSYSVPNAACRCSSSITNHVRMASQ